MPFHGDKNDDLFHVIAIIAAGTGWRINSKAYKKRLNVFLHLIQRRFVIVFLGIYIGAAKLAATTNLLLLLLLSAKNSHGPKHGH